MTFYRMCAAIVVGLMASQIASARPINYDDKPIALEIKYGKATVLRFDSKVSSVQNAEKYEIGPLNDQQPNYAEMSVRPRTTSGVDTVNFHLADGSVVMIKLIPITGAKADGVDTFFALTKKQRTSTPTAADLLGQVNSEDEEDGKAALMKALILGSKARGYQVRQVDKPLKTGLTGVEATLERVYAGKDLNGYVFKLVNTASQSKYEIDIRRLKIGEPNLALMSQVDRKVIEPEQTGRNVARLTIVALPSSLSRDVILPVSWVKKEAK